MPKIMTPPCYRVKKICADVFEVWWHADASTLRPADMGRQHSTRQSAFRRCKNLNDGKRSPEDVSVTFNVRCVPGDVRSVIAHCGEIIPTIGGAKITVAPEDINSAGLPELYTVVVCRNLSPRRFAFELPNADKTKEDIDAWLEKIKSMPEVESIDVSYC